MFLTTSTVKLLPLVSIPLAVMLPNGVNMSPSMLTLPVTVKSFNISTSLLNVAFNPIMSPNVVILPDSVRLSPVILPPTVKSPAAEI